MDEGVFCALSDINTFLTEAASRCQHMFMFLTFIPRLIRSIWTLLASTCFAVVPQWS